MSTGVIWSKSKPDVEFQYGGHLGEFSGISSQSHVSHCRVLPLDEFTVMIPEPQPTLQGAVTWRNECHDRATLQGVRIPSAILKIVFRHILFLMQFGLWRAAAFVSCPIHLFWKFHDNSYNGIAIANMVINKQNYEHCYKGDRRPNTSRRLWTGEIINSGEGRVAVVRNEPSTAIYNVQSTILQLFDV